MTELEKMLSGKIYDGQDETLLQMRKSCHTLCQKYNLLPEDKQKQRTALANKILPNHGVNCYLQGPVQFDYGKFTTVGDNFYCNFNFCVLDCAPVTIGDNVFFGPNCSVVTAVHPLIATERNCFAKNGHVTDAEYARPITIGNNCWFATGVIVCGGVTIGDNCVIGAGSIVTRNIPSNSLAVGSPAKVIRQITEQDSIKLKKELW